MTGGNMLVGHDDDADDKDGDNYDGLPAYSHQSYYHQVATFYSSSKIDEKFSSTGR